MILLPESENGNFTRYVLSPCLGPDNCQTINRTCSPTPTPLFSFLFFFSLPQLYNDEDQSKHYTLSVLRTLHYCDMVLRVLSYYRSVIACARAHARAHKAYLYIDGSVCISSFWMLYERAHFVS